MMTRMWCQWPEGKSIVYSIWIYENQHAVDDNIVGYKERFVAQGFSQKEGIDYKEKFGTTGSQDTWQSDSCVQIKEGFVWAQKEPMG